MAVAASCPEGAQTCQPKARRREPDERRRRSGLRWPRIRRPCKGGTDVEVEHRCFSRSGLGPLTTSVPRAALRPPAADSALPWADVFLPLRGAEAQTRGEKVTLSIIPLLSTATANHSLPVTRALGPATLAAARPRRPRRRPTVDRAGGCNRGRRSGRFRRPVRSAVGVGG